MAGTSAGRLADVHVRRGEHPQAQENYQQAIDIMERTGASEVAQVRRRAEAVNLP